MSCLCVNQRIQRQGAEARIESGEFGEPALDQIGWSILSIHDLLQLRTEPRMVIDQCYLSFGHLRLPA